MKATIAIASDHAGYEYKEMLKCRLDSKEIPVEDFGTHSIVSVDYPLMLQKSQKFGWQGGPKTGAAIVLEYVSEPVAGPTPPWRACAI